MKVYAVIEKSGMGCEKVIGLYKCTNKAFEVSKKLPFNGAFNNLSRSVEVMKVIGADAQMGD